MFCVGRIFRGSWRFLTLIRLIWYVFLSFVVYGRGCVCWFCYALWVDWFGWWVEIEICGEEGGCGGVGYVFGLSGWGDWCVIKSNRSVDLILWSHIWLGDWESWWYRSWERLVSEVGVRREAHVLLVVRSIVSSIVFILVRHMWSYDYDGLKSCSDLDLNRDDPAWWEYLRSQDRWHKNSPPSDTFSRFILPDFLTQIHMIMYDLTKDMFDNESVAASSTGMMTPTSVSIMPYQWWLND